MEKEISKSEGLKDEMKKKYHFGEGTVIPDGFITKNCGEYALKELGRLIDRLKGLDAKFYSAKGLAKIWKDGIQFL